jgi:hypothetical protein
MRLRQPMSGHLSVATPVRPATTYVCMTMNAATGGGATRADTAMTSFRRVPNALLVPACSSSARSARTSRHRAGPDRNHGRRGRVTPRSIRGGALRRALVAVATVLLLPGCSDSSTRLESGSVPNPYDGPMSLAPDYSDAATPLEGSGAAGQALECDGAPYGGGGGDYGDGLESVQDSPEQALDSWLDNEARAYQVPLVRLPGRAG